MLPVDHDKDQRKANTDKQTDGHNGKIEMDELLLPMLCHILGERYTAECEQKEKQYNDPGISVDEGRTYVVNDNDGDGNEHRIYKKQIFGEELIVRNQSLGKFLISEYIEAKRNRKIIMIIKTG